MVFIRHCKGCYLCKSRMAVVRAARAPSADEWADEWREYIYCGCTLTMWCDCDFDYLDDPAEDVVTPPLRVPVLRLRPVTSA